MAVVSFLDGPSKDLHFHNLNLTTGMWEALHVCGDDLYFGTFGCYPPKAQTTTTTIPTTQQQQPGLGNVNGRPPQWESTWHVKGPKKDQVIRTVYTAVGPRPN
mmetsp:Transcript_4828/g.9608  ORF Transcript_4828/g.9608 Transcript_4828/m.9608 type:complete len:103 (-) Transcript_4828:167-475(-)